MLSKYNLKRLLKLFDYCPLTPIVKLPVELNSIVLRYLQIGFFENTYGVVIIFPKGT